MKIEIKVYCALLSVLMLAACKSSTMLAPEGSVPKRSKFQTEVFGGYATLTTADKVRHSGELIGMRNDSIVLLERRASMIPLSDVIDGNVVVCKPGNPETTGLVLMIPNALLLIHSGTYSGAAGLALTLSVIDALGMIPGAAAESDMKNYFTWQEGWQKVMTYSRFPGGIPPSVDVQALTNRIMLKR